MIFEKFKVQHQATEKILKLTMKRIKFSIKFVTIKEKNESFSVKTDVNKSDFFLTGNRRIFQARLQKMKVSTILLLKSDD